MYIHPGSSVVAPPTISRIVDHRHLALKLTRNRNSFFAPYTAHEVFEPISCSGNKCCSGLKSFDSHETCHQGTDLDENFGTPWCFFYGDSENRTPGADFGLPELENSHFQFFHKSFRPGLFPSGSGCKNCPGDFCTRIEIEN